MCSLDLEVEKYLYNLKFLDKKNVLNLLNFLTFDLSMLKKKMDILTSTFFV